MLETWNSPGILWQRFPGAASEKMTKRKEKEESANIGKRPLRTNGEVWGKNVGGIRG